ncbi:MAG: hypothetical protein IJX82_04850 [Clostridia bacterium]|nr:hypothetical protein [Clostridia bacterium]
MTQDIYQQQERERLIDEVCEKVLARFSVKVETEAIAQLRDAIRKLGR